MHSSERALDPIAQQLQSQPPQAVLARFHTLLVNTRNAIFEISEQGFLRSANGRASEVSGYTHDMLVGMHYSALLEPAFLQAAADCLSRALHGQATTIDVQARRANGELSHWKLTFAAIEGAEGKVLGVYGIARDVTQMKVLTRQTKHHHTHDLLTGLPNHIYLQSYLDAESQRLEDGLHSLGVIYIDLDEFKPINSGFGYHVGDRLLKAVVQRFKHIMAPADTLVRISGDEFVLVRPDASDDDAFTSLANDLVEAAGNPFQIDGHQLNISASAGLTRAHEPVADPQKLVQQASLAMLQAKQQGCNTWHWYGRDSMPTALVSQLVIMRHQLQNALAREQFNLHYQPIVQAGTKQCRGLEALARWSSSDAGSISPAVFIPLAERTGQIVEIGRWVLRRACADMAALAREGAGPSFVSVNISPIQFRRRGFLEEVTRILQETGLSPEQLELEITEGLLLMGSDQTIELLRRLNDLGLRIAIDDFGTGYSSLSYLRKLPIHKIKIDKSFVTDLGTDNQAQAIIDSMLTMAHGLGLQVVAEGVETDRQAQLLEAMGCDLLQGFYIARPGALDTLPRK